MFIARRHLATPLCSEERPSFEPTWDRHAALPNRAGGGSLAGYKQCTPTSGDPDIVFVRVLTFAKGSNAYRTPELRRPSLACTQPNQPGHAQLASTMFAETPTVPHLAWPSPDVIKTRTRLAEPDNELLSTRTL